MTLTDTTPDLFAPLRAFAGSPCRIFPASRPLTNAETTDLLERLERFFEGWASHGTPVKAAACMPWNRFLVVAHEPEELAGCAGDALLFFLNEAGKVTGVEWTGGSRVFHLDPQGEPVESDRPGFRKLATEGTVGAETLVIDTTIRETEALLGGRFVLPARDSWHARLLG